jgi:hypothetical protein
MRSDIRDLRGKYLFWLGKLCHCTPVDVDAMRVGDLFTLIAGIDAYHESEKRSYERAEAGY